MKKEKKVSISVIMPCFNVEKYIKRAMLSVLNQVQDNIELIVVDDHSTDKTKIIIRQLISEFSTANIIFFENEKNMGAAYCRNFAIEKASGDYIGFVDSDDYVEDNYFSELYLSMQENKSDLAITDINIIYEKEWNRSVLSKATNGNINKIDFVNNGLAASPCNKLFAKNLIKRFKFLEGKMNEDVAVVIPSIVMAKRISYVPTVKYNYIQREDSIQNSKISFKRFDIFCSVDECLKRIKGVRFYYEYKRAIIFNQIIMLFVYVIPKEKSLIKREKLLSKFSHLSKKYNIRKNTQLWSFLNEQDKYRKYYYKLLLKLNQLNHGFLSSLLITTYSFLQKNVSPNVVEKNLRITDIVKQAKINQNQKSSAPTISVVIPNYNYGYLLLQRFYSILYQKIRVNEIIILDDMSKDSSRELIDILVDKLSNIIPITKLYNDKNSGSAFKQWEKGFINAKSEYVWIAEADDYCDNNFLSNVVKPLKNDEDIVISYCDTAFINTEGKIILKTIKPEIDIMKTKHWDDSYLIDGFDELKNFTFLNCTIANVSSVIFKNGNYSKYFELSKSYSQAGDWLFYANLMREGKVAYYNKPLNYYRLHGSNVSSLTKKKDHFLEIKKIHKYFEKEFGLSKFQDTQIKKRYEFLERVWGLIKNG